MDTNVFLKSNTVNDDSKTTRCFYFSGGIFKFFIYTNKKTLDIPLNIEINIINGKIIPKNPSYFNLLRNMMDSYPSSIEDSTDVITGEKQTLKLFRIMNMSSNHNVFTSLLYVTMICLPTNEDKLSILFKTMLGINNIKLFNVDYYLYYNKNDHCKKLAIIETKIYFWWYFYSNNRSKTILNSGFFSFYLWVFRNLSSLNNPTVLGTKDDRFPHSFVKYFNMIDNCKKISELFILRYGPKYLEIDTLINEPESIFKIFNPELCSNNFKREVINQI